MYDTKTMLDALEISETGFWRSDIKLFHVRSETLSDWIINYLSNQKDKQIYDFGCGNGHYLQKMKSAGFTKLTGIEGEIPKYKDYENIIQHDLSTNLELNIKGNCIFLEVAEHIPQKFENVALNNVTNACDDKLIMSWAVRGQGGLSHINEINNDEAIEKIVNRGFIYLPNDTQLARNVIRSDEMCNYFKNTLLIFKRKNA